MNLPLKRPSSVTKQADLEATCRQALNQAPLQAIAIVALDEHGDLYTCHYLHPKTRHAEVDHWLQQLNLYTAIYSKEIR